MRHRPLAAVLCSASGQRCTGTGIEQLRVVKALAVDPAKCPRGPVDRDSGGVAWARVDAGCQIGRPRKGMGIAIEAARRIDSQRVGGAQKMDADHT